MFSSPINIFFSYASSADEDKQLFYALRKHLTALKWLGYIEEWYDSAINAGSGWQLIIDAYLNNADIIVLLFSSDFLASDHCREVEMKRALERREGGTARVIYVLLRPVDWSGLFLDTTVFLPPGGNPISLWPDRDSAFVEVVKGIKKLLMNLPIASLIRSHSDQKDFCGMFPIGVTSFLRVVSSILAHYIPISPLVIQDILAFRL